MSTAAAIHLHADRQPQGWLGSILLAAAIHLLLFAVLFFGVRWQSRAPDTVSVELWVPPPPVLERAEPRPEPPLAEPPRPAPPVPKPEPKVEPKVEVPRPEIAIKDKPKPKPKPEAKPKPEPPKPAPAAKARDVEMDRRMREELLREQNTLKVEEERKAVQDMLARDAATAQQAAQQKALAAYTDKIRAKIKGSIGLLPQDIKGNPEAVFDVVQLPTGEVLSVKLKKSSGHRGYDESVERAILKASPLPKPERAEQFQRALELRFRPLD